MSSIMLRSFLLAIGCAAASASAAVGGRSSAAPHALILAGTITEGDAPSRFSQNIDLETGFTKLSKQMGASESHSGFDGQPWEEGNGIVTVTNLPSAVADRRAFAWLDSTGWRLRGSAHETTRRIVPPGAKPIELSFDPDTGLLSKATVAGDWGPEVFTYGDWRKVGPFTYPFHREELSPVGEHTIIQVESARAERALQRRSFARPRSRSHAEWLGKAPATVPFVGVGPRKTHIVVDATIDEQPAKLIFDTGAANYVTTEAAPYFGIKPIGGINLSGVGETSASGGYATVNRIALGSAALRNETIVVGPPPWPPSKGKRPELAGATGYEFFAEYVTTIDYPGDKLIFATSLPRKSGAVRVPFYNDGFHMYVRARLNGVEGLFGLDTGDGGTVTIFPAFASRFGIEGASGAVSTGGSGLGGDVKSQTGVLKRFSLGGLNFDRLPVSFSHQKTGAFASNSIAGNLGGGVLQCFRITIDFPHHFLLFDPAPGSPRCRPGGKVSRS